MLIIILGVISLYLWGKKLFGTPAGRHHKKIFGGTTGRHYRHSPEFPGIGYVLWFFASIVSILSGYVIMAV